jgi:TP901 family phage tail tape measure protein
VATSLGTLFAKLDADTREFSVKMQKATGVLEQHSAGFAAVGVAAGAVSVTLGAFAVSSVRVAAEFEAAMVRVQSVSGATGAQLEALRDTAIDLAAQTKFTAREVGSGMQFMAQAGAEVEDIIGGIPAVLQLATAGAIDLGNASDIVTNILAGFGKEVDELAAVNDVLVKTITSTNVDVAQLGESFKIVGPVAKSAGVEFNEVAAAIGLLGNAGLQGSLAGTALRASIARLLSPTKQIQDTLEDLGVSVTNSSGRLLSLTNIIARLQPHADNTGAIMQIFGQRAGPAMAALIGQGAGALRGLIAELDNAGGTAQAIADKQMDTFAGQMDVIKSQVEALQIALGDALLPALRVVQSGIQSVLSVMLAVPQPIKQIVAFLGVLAAAAAAAVAAFSGLLVVLPLLVSGLSAFAAVTPVLVAGLAAAAPVIGIVVGALALMAASIAFVIFQVGLMKRVWEQDLLGIRTAVTGFANFVASVWDGLMNGLVFAFNAVANTVRDEFAFLQAAIKLEDPFEAVRRARAERTEAGPGAEPSAIVSEALGAAVDAAGTAIGRAADIGADIFESGASFAGSAFKELGSIFKEGASAIFGGGEEVADATADVAAATTEMADTVKRASRDLTIDFAEIDLSSELKAGLAGIGDDVTEALDGVLGPAKNFGEFMERGLGEAGAKLLTSVAGMSQNLNAALQGAAEGFEAGGPVGALIGAIVALALKAQAVADAMAMVDRFLGQFIVVLGVFIKPLNELAGSILSLAGIFIDMIRVTNELGGLLLVLRLVTRGLAFAVQKVAEGFAAVINSVLNVIADALDAVRLGRAASSVRRFRITVRDFSKEMDGFSGALGDRSEAAAGQMDNLGDSMSQMNEQVTKATASMTNVPSGFKAALNRFRSIIPAAGGPTAGGAAIVTPTNQVGQIILVVDNPEDQLDSFEQILRGRNFSVGGTTLAQSSPFAVPREGS